jgi:hypothetical protein
LLGFPAIAKRNNSSRLPPKTDLSLNDVNAVGALCRRCGGIAFFRKPRARGLIFRDVGRMQRVIRPRAVAGAVVADLVGGGSEGPLAAAQSASAAVAFV